MTTTQSEDTVSKRMILPIQGMTCASCVAHVEKALKGIEGVGEANVNLATERASVTLTAEETNLSEMVVAVRDAGYDVGTEKVILPIGGMTCASCVAHVQHALSELDGVVKVNVNLATERALVEYVPGLVGMEDFRKAVADAGYEVLEAAAEVEREGEDEAERKMAEARFRNSKRSTGLVR